MLKKNVSILVITGPEKALRVFSPLVLKSSTGALILINYKVFLHHFLCPLSACLFPIACELQSFERRMLRKILFQFIVTSTGYGVRRSF